MEEKAIKCQDSNTYGDPSDGTSNKMSDNSNNDIPTNPNTSGEEYQRGPFYDGYDFDPSLYNTDVGVGGGEGEVGIGKQVQSSVIVLILVLLWLYTIAMFIRRSRFLRTTGQRQSTYKSALPGNTANGPTTTGSGGGSGCTAGGIGSTSRRQSVANAVTNSKRKQSQAKNLDGSSEGGRDRDLNLKFPSHSEKHNSITSLDDRILCNHVTTPAKKSAMKISLPSWRVERNRDDSDSLYRQPRKMSFSDIQWDPPKNYHKKKASNDSAIAPVISISQGISDQSPSRTQTDSQTGSKMVNQSPLNTSKAANRLVTSHNNPKFSLTTDSSSCVIPVDADDMIDDATMMDSYEMVETSPGADSQITITNDTDPDLEQGQSPNSFSFI